MSNNNQIDNGEVLLQFETTDEQFVNVDSRLVSQSNLPLNDDFCLLTEDDENNQQPQRSEHHHCEEESENDEFDSFIQTSSPRNGFERQRRCENYTKPFRIGLYGLAGLTLAGLFLFTPATIDTPTFFLTDTFCD